MIRWLFTFLSVVSLLLCIVALLAWRASYHSLLDINRYDGKTSWEFDISNGEMAITRVEWASSAVSNNLGWTASTHHATSLIDAPAIAGYVWQIHFRVAGFAAISHHFRIITNAFRVVWPCWFVVLLMAVLPAQRIIRRRRKPASDQACKTCGYDLTGNTSGVCPECGKPVPARS